MHQISGEEDMFLESQTPMQEQAESGADDMYISVVQAIAVKKARIVQKKEKIKFAVQALKKVNADLEEAKKESENLEKESEEITKQLNLKAMYLKGIEDFRASIETLLCNLKSKLLSMANDTTAKKNLYDATIHETEEIWKGFKEVYEQFPLAVKRRELVIKLKKVDIEIRKTKYDIEDQKRRNKIRAEIEERRQQLACIKLAEAFFTRKEKIAEIEATKGRISELRKRLEDIEAGKCEADPVVAAEPPPCSLPSQTKPKATKSSFLQFKMPQLILSPPPLDTEEEPPTTGFSWKKFFDPATLFNTQRKNQLNQVEAPKITKYSEKSTSQILGSNKTSDEGKSNRETDNTNVNSVHTMPLNIENNVLGKRNSSQIMDLTNQETKRVRFSNSLIEKNNNNEDNTSIKTVANNDQTITENVHEADKNIPNECNININKKEVMKNVHEADKNIPNECNININKKEVMKNVHEAEKNIPNECNININKKEAMKNVKTPTSSFNIKGYITKMSSSSLNIPATMTIQKNKQNLKSISLKHSINQQKTVEPHLMVMPPKPSLGSFNKQKEQPSNQTLTENHDAVDQFQEDNNENQPDNMTLTMVPTPPDVIPVENNSQPLPDSGNLRSLSSEFTSPLELDDSTKMYYQRITTESPQFFYPQGPEAGQPQTVGTEESDIVKSHYFSNGPQQTSQTQNVNEQVSPEEEYHTPYSPPINNDLESDLEGLPFVPSPVSEGVGYFGYGENSSTEKQLFNNQPSNDEGNKSPEAQFGFSFMSNPSKKSSFFSLF